MCNDYKLPEAMTDREERFLSELGATVLQLPPSFDTCLNVKRVAKRYRASNITFDTLRDILEYIQEWAENWHNEEHAQVYIVVEDDGWTFMDVIGTEWSHSNKTYKTCHEAYEAGIVQLAKMLEQL